MSAAPATGIAVDAITLPEITVTATRITPQQATYSVTLDDGRAYTVRDSAALLDTAPGAAVVRNGSQTGIVQLRGLSGDRVNVLIDGMHITPACPNHMDPPMHYITSLGLESLDVIAGIAPVSRGGDSIAGAIIADSAAPVFGDGDGLETFGRAAADYNGSNDGYTALLNAGTANERFSIAYTGERQDGGDLEFAGGTAGTSGYRLLKHDVTLATRMADSTLRLDLGRHTSRDVGTPSLPMDMIEDDADKVALSYAGEFGFGNVEAKIYRHAIDHRMDNYSLRGLSAGMLSPATSDDTGYQVKISLPHVDSIYRFGVEYLRNDFDAYSISSTLAPMSIKDTWVDNSRDRLGVYAEWQAALSPQWETVIGVRSDTVDSDAGGIVNLGMMPAPMEVADAATFNGADRSITEHNWDFTAQVRYRHSDAVSYEFAVARKSRAPSLVERNMWTATNASSGMADGRTYLGNLALDSEVSNQITLGADWRGDAWSAQPSVFYNRVDDYIQGTPIARTDSGGNAVLQYNNIDAGLYGIDGSWQYRVDNALVLSGSLSYARGKRTDVSDNLYRIAPLRMDVNAEYARGKWTHRAEWQMAARQSKVSSYNDETETGGYGLVHLRTRYRIQSNFSISAGIENLLDKRYAEHLSGVNRVTDSDVPVGERLPGAGRFGYVAVDYRF
jgi:iron complex outermembrane receptor protein